MTASRFEPRLQRLQRQCRPLKPPLPRPIRPSEGGQETPPASPARVRMAVEKAHMDVAPLDTTPLAVMPAPVSGPPGMQAQNRQNGSRPFQPTTWRNSPAKRASLRMFSNAERPSFAGSGANRANGSGRFKKCEPGARHRARRRITRSSVVPVDRYEWWRPYECRCERLQHTG